jgi:trehalose/maltose hydrolase-like predicted phosphorylase
MGPDEFHDGYPGTVAPGIDDNAYTNVLCAWLLARVLELAETLAHNPRDGVLERIGMGQDELDHMEAVSRLLYVPFHEGVISQFDGYEKLLQFDFERYRAQYGNLGRLDLILESEGDSTNHYQVAKQPDTLMLFYLLSAEELRQVLQRLGYELAPETLQRTIEYYEERSTQGSTLARVVHAWVSARADRADSWRYFDEALSSDIADIQGGTTREGIHLGAMAGTIDILQRCYTGLEVRDDRLHLNPMLPPELESINVPIAYRGHVLDIDIDHTRARVHLHSGSGAPFVIVFGDEELVLHAGDVVERPIDH